MINFLNLSEIYQNIDKHNTLILNVLSENCKFCEELKTKLPEISILAESFKIKIINTLANSENEEFLIGKIDEGVPCALLFKNGEYKGSITVNGNSYLELLELIRQKDENN